MASIAGKLGRAGLHGEVVVSALRGINEGLCTPPLDDDEVLSIAESIAKYHTDEPWDKPLDLWAAFVAPPLTARDVPPVVGRFAELQARASGFDPTATIAAGVTAAAACIDDRIRLRLPGASSWFVSALLWTLGVGVSSGGKSPGRKPMLKPIYDAHEEIIGTWIDKKKAEKEKDEEPEPKLQSIVDNTTMEALSAALHDNPRGILVLG